MIRTAIFPALLILFLAMGTLQATAGEAVTIVAPGHPVPSILAADNVDDRDAAADLCNYLSRVAGQDIKPGTDIAESGVVIHVGRTEFVKKQAPEIEKLFADGYVVKCIAEGERVHIILAGQQKPSATWAVEQFLKDICGVRFLFPDPEYGEIVPSRPTLAIDRYYSKTYEPDYVSRYNCSMTYYTPNQHFLRGRPKFYGYGNHELQWIFSEAEFKAHPEWFPYFNGKRQWWSYGNGWQICTTNPGTVDHAVKYVLNQFEKDPDLPVVSVGLNDGYGWCECPECTKFVNSFDPPYTLSDRWFHWVNQVAREVKKAYPDKWVESMAYATASAPPRFPLESNVAITKTIVVPEEIEQAEQWTKICKSVNLYSYMYGSSFLGFRHYPHAASDFLKWGRDQLGARAHITECDGDWTFDGPKYHYINELQWDADADVDAIMDDFCTQSYGVSAKPMRAFWDRLEEIYERRDKRDRMAFYVWVGWQQQSNVEPDHEMREYTREDVVKLDEWMDEALKLAADADAGVQFRIDRMNEAWRFFRSSIVSYLEFRDKPLPPKITSDQQMEKAIVLARQIAEVRAEREAMYEAMLKYPHINRRIAQPAYWSYFTGMALFNRELTLLDELARRITEYQSRGQRSASAFWQSISPEDPLAETARIQLAQIEDSKDLVSISGDGGFEAGQPGNWTVEGGNLTISDKVGRTGTHAAAIEGSDETSLLQRFSVTPGDRYTLLAWSRPADKLPPLDAPIDSIVEFYGKDARIWHHLPTRNMPYAPAVNGWLRIQSTFDVPAGADKAVVKLRRKYPGTLYFDDLVIHKNRSVDSSVTSSNSDGSESESAPKPTGRDPRDLVIPGVTD